MNFNMHIPTNIIFGAGTLKTLHQQKMPGRKALLVISNGKSTRENGSLDCTINQLKLSNVDFVIFDQISANPTKNAVMAGAAAARKHQCDFILALGGGSVMDASKGIAAMATNEGDLWDYILFGSGGKQQLVNSPLPIVAITTTAGTGSESDNGAVITNEDTNEKTAFMTPESFPVLAIIDPELMLSVPPKFTAYQGFDALFHSVEGYVSNGANLLSDMYAINAIEEVGKHLPSAVADGQNLAARTHMAFANSLSSIVMVVGRCTSEHSLEHAISAYHPDLPHGTGLIMISVAYYKWMIEKHVCDDRFIRMAQALGKKDAAHPIDFIKALQKLQQECGVGELKMSDYGIVPEEFPKFAANARSSMGFLFDCDRLQLTDEDSIQIYRNSYR